VIIRYRQKKIRVSLRGKKNLNTLTFNHFLQNNLWEWWPHLSNIQKSPAQLRTTVSRHQTGVLTENVYRDSVDDVHSTSRATSSRLILFETTCTLYPIQHKFAINNMSIADPSSRPIKRRGSATTCFLGLWVRISPGTWMSFSCGCLCCLVEVSAKGWSLVQRSPTKCGVSEFDLETSTMKRPRPTRAVQEW